MRTGWLLILALHVAPMAAHAEVEVVKVIELTSARAPYKPFAWFYRGSDRFPAQAGTKLEPGDKVQTSDRARLVLRFPKDRVAVLDPGTKLTIHEPLILSYGQLYLRGLFKVRSEYILAAARGTLFTMGCQRKKPGQLGSERLDCQVEVASGEVTVSPTGQAAWKPILLARERADFRGDELHDRERISKTQAKALVERFEEYTRTRDRGDSEEQPDRTQGDRESRSARARPLDADSGRRVEGSREGAKEIEVIRLDSTDGVGGSAWVNRGSDRFPAQVGTKLALGDRVETNDNTRLVLRFPEDRTAVLDVGTELTIDERLFLSDGQLYLQGRFQAETTSVSGGGEGTRLLLRCELRELCRVKVVEATFEGSSGVWAAVSLKRTRANVSNIELLRDVAWLENYITREPQVSAHPSAQGTELDSGPSSSSQQVEVVRLAPTDDNTASAWVDPDSRPIVAGTKLELGVRLGTSANTRLLLRFSEDRLAVLDPETELTLDSPLFLSFGQLYLSGAASITDASAVLERVELEPPPPSLSPPSAPQLRN